MLKASVVIPAFNAQKTLARCLKALERQTVSSDEFEVILVDDGSTDQTARIALEFKSVMLLKQQNAGPARARNRGAQKARAPIVVFLDSDCVAKKNWLLEMLKPFEDPAIVGVQGRYENPLPDAVARFVQFEIEKRYENLQSSMKKNGSIDFVSTYSAAYRKKIFLENGGFDEGFRTASGEDTDLSFRLAEKGHKLVFASKAIVEHYHPTNMWKYWKTKFFRAYWRVRIYRKNPKKMVKDSYTPVSLKIRTLLVAWTLFVTAYGLITIAVGYNRLEFFIFPILILLVTFFFTIPSAVFVGRRDILLGVLTPFILIITEIIFFFGLCAGLYDSFWSGTQ